MKHRTPSLRCLNLITARSLLFLIKLSLAVVFVAHVILRC